MKNSKVIEIEGNKINLKRGLFGYRVVYPIRADNGNYIWINLLFGGWGNFFKLLIILLIFLSFLFGVAELTESCRDMAEDPCKYIDMDCSRHTYYGYELGKEVIPYGEERS